MSIYGTKLNLMTPDFSHLPGVQTSLALPSELAGTQSHSWSTGNPRVALIGWLYVTSPTLRVGERAVNSPPKALEKSVRVGGATCSVLPRNPGTDMSKNCWDGQVHSPSRFTHT